MKKLFVIGMLAALLFVAMPAMAVLPLQTYHLYAGQNIHVGDVEVSPDLSGNLVIEFDMDEGWFVNETHLAIESYLADIPQKKGNPVPGKFEYSMAYEIPESNDAYVIPLSTLPGFPGVMAFQADVSHAATPGVGAPAGDALFPPPTIEYDQEEGAWAACEGIGIHAFEGKNWATYFYYPREPE